MPDVWGNAATLVKLALYIGVLGATGLVIVRIVYADLLSPSDKELRVQIALLATVGLVAAILGFMLRGAALTGGAGGLTDPEMLGLLWQTPVGDVLIYRVAGMILTLFGIFIPRIGRWVALIGGMIALWSFTQIGHVPELAATGVRLLLLLHLLGVAFWIGILGPLRTLSRQPDTLVEAASLGHRFGQAAAVSVPALILAGLVMAWLLLGDLRTLLATAYGLTLLVKLILVGVVLSLATANKFLFVPAMLAGDIKAARHLARAIDIEIAVILAVLAATAALTSVLTLPN